MNKFSCWLLSSCCVLSLAVPAMAQKPDAHVDGPPPILVIQYEMVKPGHIGTMHQRTESMFIKAMKDSHAKEHYLGNTSLSGDNSAIFFEGYGSLADWQKDMQTFDTNPTLARQMEAATVADGEMLTVAGQVVLQYVPDNSYNMDKIDVGMTRYWQIERYKIKPGHDAEWNEVVKMYGDALKKVEPDAIWVQYRGLYGHNNGGDYSFFIPMKSLVEADKSLMNDSKVAAELGADNMKKVGELIRDCVESQQNNLYRVDPKMSYPFESWTKEAPGFWNGK
jgi:hypothetical protein